MAPAASTPEAHSRAGPGAGCEGGVCRAGFPALHAGLGDSKVAGTGRLESLPYAAEVIQQRFLGLGEAGTVRSLRRRERELEAMLDDDEEIEPVKAEALRELEAIYDFMRKHPWRSRDCVQNCAQAVSRAIRCLHARLARAKDGEATRTQCCGRLPGILTSTC